MLRQRLLQACLLIAACVPGWAQAQSPEEWLGRMGEAVEYLNYEGTFVYMTPGNAETFKVYHRVDGDEVTERIVALDGAGAEIIRNARELICIFPGRQSVVVESRSGKGVKGNPLQSGLPLISGDLNDYYELVMQQADRVLGRAAEVIAVRPRDGYRYGYRLWLDRETGMPLKSQLIGDDVEMPLEEIRFTAIELPALVASAAVQTQLDTSGYSWVRQNDQSPSHENPQDSVSKMGRWVAEALPAGFMLEMEEFEYIDQTVAPRIHHVYTDGLATVSVFVDPGVAASEQAEGLAMMGSANAYSLMKDGMLVTAMGEVPPLTVEKIAASMAPVAAE